MGSKSKGDNSERTLVNYFAEAGYAVMRAPSSGAGTTRALPDVQAVNPNERLAIEHKYIGTPEQTIYIGEEEGLQLHSYASMLEGKDLFSARWSGDTTVYVFDPEHLDMTDGGRYRITREDRHRALVKLNVSERGAGHGISAEQLEERGGVLQR